MQYVGKVGDYVYSQWNSLNPATLSGAIDIIVIEQPDGTLHCSPWHVRFGKFQIIKPLQKKIDLYVNDCKTDLPMKLGEGGEAFFVFETDLSDLSLSVVTSPVVSAENSPEGSPLASPRSESADPADLNKSEPDLLDLNQLARAGEDADPTRLLNSPPPSAASFAPSRSDTPTLVLRLAFEKAMKITQELNIPSKIDVNGDMVLDMDGYKPNSQKNIELSDKLVHKIFLKEMNNLLSGKEFPVSPENEDNEETEFDLLQSVITKDKDGRIRIVNKDPEYGPTDADLIESERLTFLSDDTPVEAPTVSLPSTSNKTYIKTLRLTSEQLLSMKLQYGRNKLKFKLTQGTSQIESDLYLWKSTTPIVISDIDGTITKSDALGHVLNMFGKDWTHPGVATLFQDINRNGYNILYLTARSVGQADTTRQYLHSIVQDGGMKLPKGPVILSPDRTMAALRREIILKKPEVFKMACLRDIKSLFFSKQGELDENDFEDDRTPFYAGFGNRITDAISYRSVKIPPHRIFTINPNGEVHMELLELAGYKSSYLHIGELVDQFFPPLKSIGAINNYWDQDQLNQYIHSKDIENDDDDAESPGSPRSPMSPGSPRSLHSEELHLRPNEKYTDLNFWREPLNNLSDLSDLEDDEGDEITKSPSSARQLVLSLTGSPKLNAHNNSHEVFSSPSKEKSSASFTSPLKNFMMRGNNTEREPKPLASPMVIGQPLPTGGVDEDEDDYTDDYDDDYTNDENDYDNDDDEGEHDSDDEDEVIDFDEEEVDEDDNEEADVEHDIDEANEVDDEDFDADDGIGEDPAPRHTDDVKVVTASSLLESLHINR